MNSEKIAWPTAAIVCVSILAVVATALAGPALGASDETLRSLLAVEGIFGFVIAGLMRGVFPGGGSGGSGASPAGPVAALMVATLVGNSLTGCGASALGTQADMIAVAGTVSAEADTTIVTLRGAELDAIVEQAEAECADGCSAEVAESYRNRLRQAEARWAPALACRAPVPEALRAWVDGLDVAYRAQREEVGLDMLARFGARFVVEYDAMARCIESAAPEVEVPALPTELSTFAEEVTR